jgi:hypothetical protein
MMTEEQMMARLLAARLDKPPPPKPVPKPKPAQVKADERFAQPKPREAVAAQAAVSTKALAEQMRQDRQGTAEDRRRQREREEMAQWRAEGEDARTRYQRELDRWCQYKLDVEAEIEARRESGEIPERGIYDPMKRFESEMKGR